MMAAAATSRVSSGCMKASPSRVDQLCAQGAHLFRNQRAEDLLREGHAGGMVLQRVGIQQLCARTIAQHQAVRRCAVVVGGREALIVHAGPRRPWR